MNNVQYKKGDIMWLLSNDKYLENKHMDPQFISVF